MDRGALTACAAVFILSLLLSVPCRAEGEVTPYDFGKVKQESSAMHNTEANVASAVTLPDEEAKRYHEFRMTQERYRLIVCVILILGLVASLEIILRFITRTSYTANSIVNASGLVLIVFGTIYIVVLSDNEQQLTATIGILGAIAGYLFGTMERAKSRDNRVDQRVKEQGT